MMKKQTVRRHSPGRVIRRWALMILLIALLINLGIYLWNQRTLVRDNAMFPVLREGDLILVDKISYHLTAPGRFDIIQFPSRYEDGTSYIRRIIALPGETVQINDGRIYVNGVLQEDEYGDEPITQPGRASELITLGSDEYFVLGDRRSSVLDSREPTIGSIRFSSITGKIWMRIWPDTKLL